MTAKRNILMTMALPYANGPIHLGHMVEAIQADIWSRWQHLHGHDCKFICGTDAHGTATMLLAEKQGTTPEALTEQMHHDQVRDFDGFHIGFDNFYTTHSEENRVLSNEIYKRLQANGDIATRTITQAYDSEKNMFLADRFIRGECPRCHEQDQYGDSCEKCGATYNATDLINPTSALSNTKPIEKDSEHYFFSLNKYSGMLQRWIESSDHITEHVSNKLKEWFDEPLRDWDITRDAPYFGFEIPDAPGKYFYVWLDAPVGYMASFKNLCDRSGDINFDDYWGKDSKAELFHFIGKDIIYFHSLFWPAMLHSAEYRLPTAIFVHGFLTINGEKMSKSRGTFITANDYLKHLPAEYLRYYFAAKLNSQIEDIDLNLNDFMARVNSDLVGKYVNLASRCAGFITKKFDGKLADHLHDENLFNEFIAGGETIAKDYESLNYNRCMRDIMALADRANQYIDHHKPWALAKEPGNEETVQLVCTQGLNLFKVLTTYLKPVLPETAAKVEAFLNTDSLDWHSLDKPLLNHSIEKFKPLMQRITPEMIEALS